MCYWYGRHEKGPNSSKAMLSSPLQSMQTISIIKLKLVPILDLKVAWPHSAVLQMQCKRKLNGGKLGNDFFRFFSVGFWIPIRFSNLNLSCFNILDLRNLQEQLGKTFGFKNCSDLSIWSQKLGFKNLQVKIEKSIFLLVSRLRLHALLENSLLMDAERHFFSDFFFILFILGCLQPNLENMYLHDLLAILP